MSGLLAPIYTAVLDALGRLTAQRAENLDQIAAARMAKLDALDARLTTARAALLDEITAARMAQLDAAVSSRAAASTALSTATWSNARAANLDQITSTRMAKLDALRTAITDARMAKIDALDARLTDGRAAVLDALGSGVPTARQVSTGVVRTLTDTGPAYAFSRTEQMSDYYGFYWDHYYNFTQKPERWIADVSVPEIVNIDKALIFLQGSAKFDDLTYFRRPVCARVLDDTTLRLYVDDTRSGAEVKLHSGRYSDATSLPESEVAALALAWSIAAPGGPSSGVSTQINGHDIRWTLVECV